MKKFEECTSWGGKKSALLRERGHRCEVCSNSEWMGKPIPVTLDHIDGNPDNDTKENLRIVCPNCHAQTPTFGGANKGKHPDSNRRKIMKRYIRSS